MTLFLLGILCGPMPVTAYAVFQIRHVERTCMALLRNRHEVELPRAAR
jgi:hypothetical protein